MTRIIYISVYINISLSISEFLQISSIRTLPALTKWLCVNSDFGCVYEL